jgi:hypothetical protein
MHSHCRNFGEYKILAKEETNYIQQIIQIKCFSKALFKNNKTLKPLQKYHYFKSFGKMSSE